MKFKKILFACCMPAAVFLLLAFSQNVDHGAISGKIKDKITGKVIPYAGVVLERAGQKVAVTISDLKGEFIFTDRIPGRYGILVASAGYRVGKVENVIIKKDSTTNIELSLEPLKVLEQDKDLREEKVVQSYDCTVSEENQSMTVRTCVTKNIYKSPALKSRTISGKSGVKKNIGGVIVSEPGNAPLNKVNVNQPDFNSGRDNGIQVNTGVLTAGELNDFSKWILWKDVQSNELSSYQDTWKIFVKERYTVQVINENKLPVTDAIVCLENSGGEVISQARTDNTGKAELWAGLFKETKTKNVKISVESQGRKYYTEDAKTFIKGINTFLIPVSCYVPDQVDIAFVVDATASMDDEINFLKTDLEDIIVKTKNKLPGLHVNLGSVFYRCFGNSYVTKMSDFSDNVQITTDFINAQSSGEGGDEAVEEALDVAVNKMSWSSRARSRIVFLILDEMPLTTGPVIAKVHSAVESAMKKGIRIIPVVASAETMSHARSMELLMRSIALATNGTYTFLTDHSKVGNEHSKPVTDEYDVQSLNGLLCNIIYRFTFAPDCENPINTDSLKDTLYVYKNPLIAHVVIDSSRRTNPVFPPDYVTDYTHNTTADTNNLNLSHDTLMDTSALSNINHSDNIVNKLNRAGFKYYPNPTRGPLTLEVEGNIQEVFLADITGKLLEKFRVNDQRKLEINIRNYPNGIYFLEFLSDEKWQTGKVILIN